MSEQDQAGKPALAADGAYRRANKDHTCRWCGNLIPAGSEYFRQSNRGAYHVTCAQRKFGVVYRS